MVIRDCYVPLRESRGRNGGGRGLAARRTGARSRWIANVVEFRGADVVITRLPQIERGRTDAVSTAHRKVLRVDVGSLGSCPRRENCETKKGQDSRKDDFAGFFESRCKSEAGCSAHTRSHSHGGSCGCMLGKLSSEMVRSARFCHRQDEKSKLRSA